jgi:hypothetical protein
MAPRSLLTDKDPMRRLAAELGTDREPGAVAVTGDLEVIRRWAAQRGAEPATGEATPSGPATRDVQDGGAGIRFNFPGAALFRPITWDEWFENFREHDLRFVYEEDVPGRPASNRYRLIRSQDLGARMS